MTKLTYDICKNEITVKNVATYKEAVEAVAELGHGYSYKAVYKSFNPEKTQKDFKVERELAQKRMAKIRERKTQAKA